MYKPALGVWSKGITGHEQTQLSRVCHYFVSLASLWIHKDVIQIRGKPENYLCIPSVPGCIPMCFYVTGRTRNSKTAAVKSFSVHKSTDYIFSDTLRKFSAMFSKGDRDSFRDFPFAYL